MASDQAVEDICFSSKEIYLFSIQGNSGGTLKCIYPPEKAGVEHKKRSNPIQGKPRVFPRTKTHDRLIFLDEPYSIPLMPYSNWDPHTKEMYRISSLRFPNSRNSIQYE